MIKKGTKKELLGAWMVGGGGSHSQDSLTAKGREYYPTPVEATVALIDEVEVPPIVWEPACGEGAIADVLLRTKSCKAVEASDLYEYGYGQSGRDFLAEYDLGIADGIVTNPPFTKAAEFIEHACGTLKAPFVAMLLKSTFWHAKRRLPLFETHPPSAIYPLTWRLDFRNKGRPTMECMWCVWDNRQPTFETIYKPLKKPTL